MLEIPGFGEINLDDLPPYMADEIQVRGGPYVDVNTQFGDLPPLPPGPLDEIETTPLKLGSAAVPPSGTRAEAGPDARGDALTQVPFRSLEESRVKEALRVMEERKRYPSGTIPEDAYLQGVGAHPADARGRASCSPRRTAVLVP